MSGLSEPRAAEAGAEAALTSPASTNMSVAEDEGELSPSVRLALELQRDVALAVCRRAAPGDQLERGVGREAGEAYRERAVQRLALMAQVVCRRVQLAPLAHFLEHMAFKGTPSRTARRIAEEEEARLGSRARTGARKTETK